MRITKQQLRQIIRESFHSGFDGPAFYAQKARMLERAIDILRNVEELDRSAPAGEDEDLSALISDLEGYLDAVQAMVDYS